MTTGRFYALAAGAHLAVVGVTLAIGLALGSVSCNRTRPLPATAALAKATR